MKKGNRTRKIQTGDDRRGTPKMFALAKFWGRRSAGPVFAVLLSLITGVTVSALTYQNDVDIGFTFNPTVSIAVSDDLSIDNLSPGNYSDSNEITIVSGTNNLAGYTLYATVGDNTHSNPSYNNTNLNHPNGTNTFTSISTNKASLSSFDANSNTWGYSYCIATNDCTDGTYWISGDYDSNNGNPSTGYNGLPLYTTVNGVKLVDAASNASTSTIKFKIGARAANTQIAGTYTNVINFTAITKILTTNYTITYNDTTAEATGMPTSQSDTITINTNVTLSSTEPTRDGYNFAGWCTVNNSSDPTTCSGTTYQAGSTYTINNTGGNVTVPLYAVWESAGYNLTYDLTFPSAVPTYVTYYSTSGQWVDINIGTGSHLVGSVTIPTDLAHSGGHGGTLRIRFTKSAAGSGNTCMVNGETYSDCPTLSSWWWLPASTMFNSGYLDVVLIIAGWD